MNLRSVLLASVLLFISFADVAVALTLTYYSESGELLDQESIQVTVSNFGGVPLVCKSRTVPWTLINGHLDVTVMKATLEQAYGANACESVVFEVGKLVTGTYEVTASVRSPDGLILESVTDKLRVLSKAEARCNRDPLLSPSIEGWPTGMTATEFVDLVAKDPAFAAGIGNPAVKVREAWGTVLFDYPPLEDIPPAMERLERNVSWLRTDWDYGGYGLWRTARVCDAKLASDIVATFVEYFNPGLDHYFYTVDAGEIAAIDAGKVGPVWQRTGKSYEAVTSPPCGSEYGQSVVYRFNSIPNVGPNSHFFTRDRAECSAVHKTAKWTFEGVPFWASPPQC